MECAGHGLQKLPIVSVKVSVSSFLFLIDSETVVSIVLLAFLIFFLFVWISTASGDPIRVHGEVNLSININSLCRIFSWLFVVADVTMSLLGMIFFFIILYQLQFVTPSRSSNNSRNSSSSDTI